jgi:hypothetical protein
LSGATLDPGATCMFSLSVMAMALGVQTNTKSPIAFNGGLSGPPASTTTSVDVSFFLSFFLQDSGDGSH